MDVVKKFISLFLLAVILTACGGGDTAALKQNVKQNELKLKSIIVKSKYTQTLLPKNISGTIPTFYFLHNNNSEQLLTVGINDKDEEIALSDADYTIIDDSISAGKTTVNASGILNFETLADNTTKTISVRVDYGTLSNTANIVISSQHLQTSGLQLFINNNPVNAATQNVTVCDSIAFTANGAFDDGSTRTITQKIDWPSAIASGDRLNAKFNSADLFNPLFSAHTNALYTLNVSYDSQTEILGLDVAQGNLTGMVINPASKTLQINNTQLLSVSATINSKPVSSLETRAKWSTENAAIADININSGVVTAKAIGGPIAIVAQCGTAIKKSNITVKELVLSSVEIRDENSAATEEINFTIRPGTPQRKTLTLYAHYTDNSVVNISAESAKIIWSKQLSSGLVDSVTVSGSGVVTASSGSITTISAEYKGQKDSLTVKVTVQN